MKDLVQHGPSKHPSEHGLTEEQIQEASNPSSSASTKETTEITVQGLTYIMSPDPTGRRSGHAPTQEMAHVILETLNTLHNAIDKQRAAEITCIDPEGIEKAMRDCQGAVAMAYPMGLPEYDPVREIFEDDEDLKGSAASKLIFDRQMTSLWWASKEMQPGKLLSDYVGRNEKTKIVAKLQKVGSPRVVYMYDDLIVLEGTGSARP